MFFVIILIQIITIQIILAVVKMQIFLSITTRLLSEVVNLC